VDFSGAGSLEVKIVLAIAWRAERGLEVDLGSFS